MDGPDKKTKYADLHQLSTQKLEAILQADLAFSESTDTNLALYIMEVIAERENATSKENMARTQKAWEEFLSLYLTPEGIRHPLYPVEDTPAAPQKPDKLRSYQSTTPRNNRHRLRRILATTVAAVLVLMFFVPSALGYESFHQMVGIWTEEKFLFQSDNSKSSIENYEYLQQVFSDNSIPLWIVPTDIPEGFELRDIEVFDQPESYLFEIDVLYMNNDLSLTMSFRKKNGLASAIFEKDNEEVQEYISNGVKYYFFKNLNQHVAAWSINNWECAIFGDISVDDLKIMIDSISER